MDAIGATGRIATCYAYRDAHELHKEADVHADMHATSGVHASQTTSLDRRSFNARSASDDTLRKMI
jgi:hypothetical protein